MSKSPYGNISRMNVEWSSKGRKEENALRGLNHTARRQNIIEQVADMEDDVVPFDHLDEIAEEILEDALVDGLPANVTFNGYNFDPDYYDYNDWD